jgi:hypothetical protein
MKVRTGKHTRVFVQDRARHIEASGLAEGEQKRGALESFGKKFFWSILSPTDVWGRPPSRHRLGNCCSSF